MTNNAIPADDAVSVIKRMIAAHETGRLEPAQAAYEDARNWIADRARAPLAAPVVEGWRPIETAPRDGAHVLLNLGETIPDLVDARVGQFITEKDAEELGEIVSASGGWIIWDTGGDWFVVPYADVFGWASLPTPPGTAPSGTAEVEPWTREDLAESLARLDGIVLKDIRSTVGPADDANNWREYLGRADDLLADLSLCVSTAAHPPSVEAREPDAELVQMLVEVRDRGLVYWAPNTAFGEERKVDMLLRIDALLSKHGGNDA